MASKYAKAPKKSQFLSSVLDQGEKITSQVLVNKTGKKGKLKSFYIIISSYLQNQSQHNVYFIQKTDKDTFKNKNKFALAELEAVDGITQDDLNNDFELQIDQKIYHFHAKSWNDKKLFLVALWKCCKTLPYEKLPNFKCINKQMLAETVYLSASLKGIEADDEHILHNESVEHEYKYLTSVEEKDLEAVTERCVWQTENAEKFINKLTKELSGLDKANIHSIMNVEKEVDKLFKTMDEALIELENIEQKLVEYNEILEKKRSSIESISQLSTVRSTGAANKEKLLDKTSELIEVLELSVKLEDLAELNDANIHQFSNAVVAVQDQMDSLVEYDLADMKCVAVTLKQGNAFLINVPDLLHNQLKEKLGMSWQGKHRARHAVLSEYSSLLLWCKVHDDKIFQAISQTYEVITAKIYDREINNFFAKKLIFIQKRSKADQGFSFVGKQSAQSMMDISGSQRALHRGSMGSVDSVNKGSGDSLASFNQQNEQLSKFDKHFREVLEYVEPLVVEEEDNLHKVFGIPLVQHTNPNVTDDIAREVKASNQQMERLLIKLFGKLENELKNLVDLSFKVDNYHSLYMYVRLVQHMKGEDGRVSPFMAKCYGTSLILVKRLFTLFIRTQEQQIIEQKVPKKGRCGILHCVRGFEHFTRDAEKIFVRQERRIEIEKAYQSLLGSIFKAVNRIAEEQVKVAPEIVMFENYHHLHTLLCVLSLPCLASEQKEALREYNTNLERYIKVHLGNPIDKISNFFSGVKASLASGVKHEEVGYQLSFSRHELKSVIKASTFKEIRKGVEQAIYKMEKHLNPQEGLFPKSCDCMCEHLISQIREYEELIKLCYPDSGLRFEFRKEEISSLFQDYISAKDTAV